jgi:hypothetical protein
MSGFLFFCLSYRMSGFLFFCLSDENCGRGSVRGMMPAENTFMHTHTHMHTHDTGKRTAHA